MQLFKSLKIYKEYQKIQRHILTGVLYLVILVGIITNSCKSDTQGKEKDTRKGDKVISNIIDIKKMQWNKIDLIDKKCNSDFIFIQAEYNKFDTVTIFDYYIDKSFYSQDSSFFTLALRKKSNKIKEVFFPRITICNKGIKTIGRAAISNNSHIPASCDFFFIISPEYNLKMKSEKDTIMCFWRPKNMSDF